MRIERAAAEEDLVWIHVLNNAGKIPDPAHDFVAVDIFLVEDNLIVEHFDIIQSVPKYSANPNLMMRLLGEEYKRDCFFGRVSSESN